MFDARLSSLWTEKKGAFHHPSMEIDLKLPKGWHRAPDEEVDGTLFHAYSADSNAYVSVEHVALGTGYSLEDWSEGILDAHVEIAVDGEVKSKKVKFAKQDAISYELVRDGKAHLVSTAYAWKRNGFGFLATGSTWDESPKKIHKETSSLLKSIKLPR